MTVQGRRVWLATGLLVIGLATAIPLVVHSFRRPSERRFVRTYEIEYKWDAAISGLSIKDVRTGRDERDAIWRRRITNDAATIVANLTRNADYSHAAGRFFITYLGDREPYLPLSYASTEDPLLIRQTGVPELFSAILESKGGLPPELLRRERDGVNSATPNAETPLMAACALGNVQVVVQLLRRGARVNVADRHGETPLFYAMGSRARDKIVRILLRSQASVADRSDDGSTALHYAADYGLQPELVRVLISRGANVNAKSAYGETPLHVAAQHGRAKIIKVLLDNGADINARDRSGTTALGIAQQLHRNEATETLIRAGGTV